MYSFETILHASADELVAIFSSTRVGPLDSQGEQREQIAQQLGINVTQMICGFGFNPLLDKLTGLIKVLGFAAVDALVAERNYLVIHDRYQDLSINNILEIYTIIGRLKDPNGDWSDLVLTRINSLEGQLEETINPILIGGYKLEIRSIYERKLASKGFVKTRLQEPYALLREMCNETLFMLENKAISPPEFLASPGVTTNEKTRAIFHGLVDRVDVESYIQMSNDPEESVRLHDALQ